MTILPYSPIVFGVSIKSDYAEWRQHRSKKYFSDVTNLYDVTIRRFMYISYTFSWKTGFVWFANLLPEFTKKKLRDYKAWLVRHLVHLRHSWQNQETIRARQWDRELNVLNTKFLWAENEMAHNFAKSRKVMENTIEDLANMIVFCWYGILFLYMPKHGLFLFQKRLFSDLVAPFYLVFITCSYYRFG